MFEVKQLGTFKFKTTMFMFQKQKLYIIASLELKVLAIVLVNNAEKEDNQITDSPISLSR